MINFQQFQTGRKLNLKFFTQLSETLPIELTEIHKIFIS